MHLLYEMRHSFTGMGNDVHVRLHKKKRVGK